VAQTVVENGVKESLNKWQGTWIKRWINWTQSREKKARFLPGTNYKLTRFQTLNELTNRQQRDFTFAG